MNHQPNPQQTIPSHIAIIMDGNRRWARQRGLPSVAGHKKVADEVLEPLIEHAAQIGIRFVTLWAFSTENWQRDPLEVKAIMAIFRRSLKAFGQKMHKKGIRILVIGDMTKFDADIRNDVRELIELTRSNTRITVVFALNYGGRDELVRAISRFMENKSGQPQITSEEFSVYLDTAHIPDPDMIVRTGGEQRLSGFLPWQSVYSELYFPAWYMPDFTPDKLDEVILEYNRRIRRFGK